MFVSAGEVSGDRYAADVVSELRASGESWRVAGLGGPRMAEAGVALAAGLDRLAVMGVAEVARRVPWFLRLRREIVSGWRRDPPDAVLLVDYPGLNLRLARDARRLGLATLYYVTPTVWAWNEGRVRTLARVDRRLVILPFEERWFAERDLSATYVGHPFGREARRDRDRVALRRELGLDPAADVLALLPGSRAQELRALARPFAAAGGIVQRRASRPVELAFGAATVELADELRRHLRGDARIVVGRTADLLALADVALVKSGTVTVEAALLGTPIVVGYRMNPLTFALARRLVRVRHAAMVNILSSAEIVPELLQGALTPEALATRALELLDPGGEPRRRMLAAFQRLREDLLRHDAPREVAQAVRDTVGARRAGRVGP